MILQHIAWVLEITLLLHKVYTLINIHNSCYSYSQVRYLDPTENSRRISDKGPKNCHGKIKSHGSHGERYMMVTHRTGG